MDQYIGRFLDNRYEILEIIGTGGMAVVYKARCHRLNRLVAIKILKDEFSRDEEFRRRFHAEGEAVASLSHPNIVQVYDVSTSDSANFIVMELIDGITLKQYMEKKGTLNWKETLHFAMQIAKALEHAHGRGIVHRDIKPHNVMVLKNGSVKVTDFGIARVMSKTNTLTKEALGSVHYISPEQAKGGWVDNRSDLYSLSVVMYEMMTGRPPYDGESPVAVAIKHINGGAPRPTTLNPNIPDGLEQIIMKGMELDVKDRYASATEMLQDMEQFRVNPAIRFSYAKAVSADATVVLNPNEVAQAVRQSRTAPEKAPRSPDSTPRTRTQQGTRPAGQTGSRSAAQGTSRQPQQRTRTPGTQTGRNTGSVEEVRRASDERGALPRRKTREEIRREVRQEERNRAATIAVVVCSLVAIIAIIIFLAVLFNGGMVGRGENMIYVPDLEGKYYDQAGTVAGLVIEVDKYVNSDEYEKGKIISHTPEYGAQVLQGTVVKVTVSLGPATGVKTMGHMVGYQEADARAVLAGMGMVPVAMEEFSDDVEKGRVARTDPEAGVQLQDGQTVYIYISKGPLIETAPMPNVVGLDYATAKKTLEELGFTVSFERRDSSADKDEVIEQPFPKDEKVDITTRIILVISRGNKTAGKETQGSDRDEEDYPDYVPQTPNQGGSQGSSQSGSQNSSQSGSQGNTNQTKTKQVRFSLPTDRTEPYMLGLYQNGMQVIEDTIVGTGMTSIDVVLTGSGVQTYDLYINNQFYKSVKVDFNAND